jgi:tetratricopeptide (TPR) repeat protein
MTEGTQLLERALSLKESIADPLVRARLLTLKAALTFDGGLGVDAGREAVDILRRCDDPVLLVDALRWYANSSGRSGNPAEGVRLLGEALALARKLGVPRLTVAVLNWYGYTLAWRRDSAGAHAAFGEAIALAREVGDVVRAPLANFAELLFSEGHVARAITTSREAVEIIRNSGQPYLAVIGLANQAAYLLAAGELHDAWVTARESMDYGMRQGRYGPMAIAIQHLAQIAARTGDTERAARLTGYSDAVFQRENHEREPTERAAYDRILAILRTNYAPPRLQALLEEGKRLGDAEAVELASEIAQPARVRTA